MDRAIVIPLFITILAIGIFGWAGQIINIIWLFIPVTIISFLIYLRTFYYRMPTAGRTLPLYLFALSIQMLHFAEEYLTEFVVALPAIFNQDPYPVDYWLVFNMAAYSFFILGAVVLFRGIKELSIIPLFFVLYGVFFNVLAHLSLAAYSGGYFPGLYTASIYLLLIPYLIKAFFMTPNAAE